MARTRTLLHVRNVHPTVTQGMCNLCQTAKGSLFPLSGLRGLDHRKLNLIGKAREVDSQSVEKLPLGLVGSMIANLSAFGGVPAQLLQLSLIVPHSSPPTAKTLSTILVACRDNETHTF